MQVQEYYTLNNILETYSKHASYRFNEGIRRFELKDSLKNIAVNDIDLGRINSIKTFYDNNSLKHIRFFNLNEHYQYKLNEINNLEFNFKNNKCKTDIKFKMVNNSTLELISRNEKGVAE